MSKYNRKEIFTQINMTIAAFINSMIDNIDDKQIPKEIDLILDGGAFNGIYMLGGLFYLKEMERRGKIIIKRISGCSIGALMGLCFLTDKLDIAFDICNRCYKIVRKKRKIKYIINEKLLRENMDDTDLIKLQNNLYMTYFDAFKGKQILKKNYKNNDDIINCILKTVHIPYLSNGSMTYKDGCIDGAFPYMFKKRYKNRKIIFLNLQSFDKITKMLFIKNEKNIYPRIFEGLLDMHKFIETRQPNNMCSYVDDWGMKEILLFRLREIIYTMIIYIFGLGLHIEYLIPDNWKNEQIVKKYIIIFKNLWTDVMIYMTI